MMLSQLLLVVFGTTSLQEACAFTPSSPKQPIIKNKPSSLQLSKNITPDSEHPQFFQQLKFTSDLTRKTLATTLGSFLLLTSTLFSPVGQEAIAAPSTSSGPRVIGEIAGSGIFFKDTLTVESFDDPKVQGVTLYISNFQRPLNERLQKDFFSDPSTASVGCAKTGPVRVADNIGMGKGGEEVFEENKSLLFKQLRVQVRKKIRKRGK